VSQVTYAALYAVIGLSYGNPGGGNFNLPDLRGRVPVGLGTHASVDVLGDSEAAALANRTPRHKHTVNDPGHIHSLASTVISGAGTDVPNTDPQNVAATSNTNSAVTNVTVGPQTGEPTDSPAFQTVQFIVKT
jgi:microcystin-dependent protein